MGVVCSPTVVCVSACSGLCFGRFGFSEKYQHGLLIFSSMPCQASIAAVRLLKNALLHGMCSSHLYRPTVEGIDLRHILDRSIDTLKMMAVTFKCNK